MKQILIQALALSLTLTPVAAQNTGDDDLSDGFNLMEEGAKLLLRGLLNEMDPAVEELRDLADQIGPQFERFADEMGPAFAEMMQQVDDLRHYAPPEMLPNGDIIIRRRDDAPEYVPEIADDTGEVEL